MNIHYSNTITVSEVNSIRKAMGWRQILPEQMQEELDHFEFIVSAYDDDKAIGMAAPDGTILIIPEYQFIGIEDEFMSQILSFLRKKLKPGYGIQLDIHVWNERQIELYKKLGFQISTPEKRGIPMHICITDQIELTDKMFKQMEFAEK